MEMFYFWVMAIMRFFSRYRSIIFYGISLALLLFLLKWLELRFVIFDHALEIYMGAIALLFTGLGIWLAMKLTKPQVHTVLVEKEIYVKRTGPFIFNEAGAARLGISKRELEVLELMAKGHSNEEIAKELFLSVPTIKTHGTNLFEKLEVKRRTQAVEKAKKLELIP